MRLIALAAAALALSGCIVADVAETAVKVATIPVNVASAGVDAATTSQSEKDEQRGRELRKADEERGRLLREAEKRCLEGKALPGDDCGAFPPR